MIHKASLSLSLAFLARPVKSKGAPCYQILNFLDCSLDEDVIFDLMLHDLELLLDVFCSVFSKFFMISLIKKVLTWLCVSLAAIA